MLNVSVRAFRIACAIALISLLLEQLPRFGLVTFSEGVSNAREWRYFDATAPVWAFYVYAIVQWPLLLVGLIGMFNFWRYSRWCLLIALVGSIAMRPFLGLSVYAPYEAVLASLFGAATVWVITVSFCSPLAERFTRRAGAQIVP